MKHGAMIWVSLTEIVQVTAAILLPDPCLITPSRPVAAASLTKANFSTVIENKKSSPCNCNNHRQGENICHDSEACAGAYETNQIFMLPNVIGKDTAQR